MKIDDIQNFVRRGQAAQAAVDEIIARVPKYRCLKCSDTGKADRGNGSTKPCDCAAGVAEAARRRLARRRTPCGPKGKP